MSLSRFEEELRRSAAGDAPSDAQRATNRARALEAAGLAVVAATGIAGAAASEGANAGATTGAKGLGVVKLVVVALAIAVAGAAAIFGGLRSGGHEGTTTLPVAPGVPATAVAVAPGVPATVAAVASSAPAVVEAPASAPEAVASAPLPASASASAPSAPSPNRAPSSATVAARPSSEADIDPLTVETRLLEETRRCMAAGDLTCASSRLTNYEARFPRGVLADEAALLRIDVARAQGDKVTARRLAERLLASHPTGTYARRARAILSELGEQ